MQEWAKSCFKNFVNAYVLERQKIDVDKLVNKGKLDFFILTNLIVRLQDRDEKEKTDFVRKTYDKIEEIEDYNENNYPIVDNIEKICDFSLGTEAMNWQTLVH